VSIRRLAILSGRSAEHAPTAGLLIAELQAAGVTSLRGIAAALNERGVPNVAESGRWYHAQVGRLLARLAVSTTLPP
jgi:hypothetical protein